MRCPFCGNLKTKVIDKRPGCEGNVNRRRRVCIACNRRFTTKEKVILSFPFIIKKDGSREKYDKLKLVGGVLRSCKKRPLSSQVINKIVSNVEASVLDLKANEVPSSEIGKLVLEELGAVDKVAYLRFASFYKEFNDIQSFEDELKKIKG